MNRGEPTSPTLDTFEKMDPPGKMIETKIFVVWGTTTLGTYYQKCGTDRRICIHVILKNDIPQN